MDKHAVSAERVINIHETSFRLLPVKTIGWSRRGDKQAQLQSNTRELTTFTAAFSMDRGTLDMLLQIVHAGNTDAVLEEPWPLHTSHVTSESGWATTTTLLQLTATLDDVMNPIVVENRKRERETESMFQGSVELRGVASRAADQDPHGSVKKTAHTFP